MDWRWNARRIAISLFLLIHMSGTLVWVMPACPLRQTFTQAAVYYMFPTGLWQYWAMFAPEPMRDSLTLEAEVIDSHGLRHLLAFTRLGDYSWWAGILRFRHSKYAANMAVDELLMAREFAAKHAVRKLELPDDAFPIDVNVIFQVRKTSPPGQPPADAMTPTAPVVVGSYHYASLKEVRP